MEVAWNAVKLHLTLRNCINSAQSHFQRLPGIQRVPKNYLQNVLHMFLVIPIQRFNLEFVLVVSVKSRIFSSKAELR
jgi:hypothetical protein